MADRTVVGARAQEQIGWWPPAGCGGASTPPPPAGWASNRSPDAVARSTIPCSA